MKRSISLAYGQGYLNVDLPRDRVELIEPKHVPGLPHERAAMQEALRLPIEAAPLRDWVTPDGKVCIVFTDITRATPNERLIPWLLAELAEYGIAPEQITLLNALGTHRGNTQAELETLLTREVVARYRVLNHEPENPSALVQVGTTRGGAAALLNRHFMEADLRIVTGFIEPHFFAGYSGGPKGIMPGIAGTATIESNHGAANIGDSRARFGATEGNPVWEEMRDIALLAGPSFLINVTLNEHRQITRFFAGDLVAAHRGGCAFVRETAMQPVAGKFPIVVTTNSGYPLDQNLYQAVKGMRAAAQIVADGGTIILAAECREGGPSGSPHEALLANARDPADLLARINAPGFAWPEQWAAQIQGLVQERADIWLYSSLPPEQTRRMHLKPCADIARLVDEKLAALPPSARVAVMPQGPLTIAYSTN